MMAGEVMLLFEARDRANDFVDHLKLAVVTSSASGEQFTDRARDLWPDWFRDEGASGSVRMDDSQLTDEELARQPGPGETIEYHFPDRFTEEEVEAIMAEAAGLSTGTMTVQDVLRFGGDEDEGWM